MPYTKDFHIDFYGKNGWLYGWISITEEHYFSIQISKIHKGNISICDLGAINELDDSTQPGPSKFSNPQPSAVSFEYQIGNGYIIKLDMNELKKPMYIRLYCGKKIEYQSTDFDDFPFLFL
jgi:hypothetical protein